MIPVIMHSGIIGGFAFGQVLPLSQEARLGWVTRVVREISWF